MTAQSWPAYEMLSPESSVEICLPYGPSSETEPILSLLGRLPARRQDADAREQITDSS